MALTGTSPYFIAVGVLQMIFAVIIIICSGIVLDTFLPSRYAALAILGLFFVIPGILCICAGTTKKTSYIAASIATNIFSMLLSTVGLAISSIYFIFVLRDDSCSTENNIEGDCICFQGDSYRMSCEDGMQTRNILSVLVVMYILMNLTTFAGSVIGCIGICCEKSEVTQNQSIHQELPLVIVDAGESRPTLEIISTNNSHADP